MLYQAATNFSCFAIDVTLTDVGTEHVADVAAVVFEYIGLLRKEGPQEWVAKEVKDVHDMNFRFISKSEPSDYAVRVAEAMHLYPKDFVLSGDKLVFDLDLSKVGNFLEYLRPSNALVLVIHKGLAGKTSLKEKWYGTPYNYRPVDVPEMQRWEACVTGGVSGVTSPTTQLTLPIPNSFMPTDFTVHSVDSGWSSIHERSLQTGPVVIDLETSVDDRTKGCYDVPVDTTDSGVSLGDSSLIAANATDGDN
ncbi:Ide, partial [Symbiodinium microadriaticum]